MQVRTLFSGSSGNCALLQTNQTNVLIDCGMNYRALTYALKKVGITPQSIDAVFITHAHSDHIGGLFTFLGYNPTTEVFVHKDGFAELYSKISWEANQFDCSFEFKGIKIDYFRCSHDVSCCVGYRFTAENKSICYVTDTGCVNDSLVDFVKGCNSLVIESNHDLKMLHNGNYPYFLKQRINSAKGHLSNAQTAGLLEAVLGYGTDKILLAHLSENNNLPQIAYDSAKEVATRLGVKAEIYVSTQRDISEVI